MGMVNICVQALGSHHTKTKTMTHLPPLITNKHHKKHGRTRLPSHYTSLYFHPSNIHLTVPEAVGCFPIGRWTHPSGPTTPASGPEGHPPPPPPLSLLMVLVRSSLTIDVFSMYACKGLWPHSVLICTRGQGYILPGGRGGVLYQMTTAV